MLCIALVPAISIQTSIRSVCFGALIDFADYSSINAYISFIKQLEKNSKLLLLKQRK